MSLPVIFRKLLQFKLNTIIIIISLSIGIACINLISLFVFRELRTDDFHKNSERIYALSTNDQYNPGHKEYFCRAGSAEYIKQNFTQVEDFCRFRYSSCLRTLVNNFSYDDPPKMIEASANFFDFFSYELLTNNPKTALETSESVVISSELAEKYFGSASPMGQIIHIVSGGLDADLIVSGVFCKPQQNSQLDFDMVRKMGERDSPCFLRLAKGTTKEEIENQLAENILNIPTFHDKDQTTFYLSSLRNTYFDPLQRSKVELNRNINDLWIALGIGVLIMLIALFNYLGLVNNSLQEKQKEYTIRLINGSSKGGLVKDFMIENLSYLVISFLISIGLMIWAFPAFNQLIRTNLQPEFLLHPLQLLLLVGSVILVASACYFFVLIKIRKSLKAGGLIIKKQEAGKVHTFSPFNIFQLASTIILIVVSMVIIKQIRYISEKPIGIDKEVVEIKIPWAAQSVMPVFSKELQKVASITMVSAVSTSPVLDHWLAEYTYYKNGEEKAYTPAGFEGDENYIRTLGIRIVEGNDFSQDGSNRNKCLINQTLAQQFSDEYMIGKHLPGTDYIIIGIAEDFHYNDLKSFVEPAIIVYSEQGNYLLAKPAKGQLAEAKEYIVAVWHELLPDYPVNIESIHDRYEWLHRENRNFVKLISACCFISVFLSMIGLFAISVEKSRKRIKEIGIRKVNGAKVYEILALLNIDFVKWVAIAYVIACPFAWYATNNWLENFAYKTNLSWWIFALAGILALGIALITISWQSWRAATRNPVEALRYQ